MELPDEIWEYIKEFTFDWKQTHKKNLDIILAIFYLKMEKFIKDGLIRLLFGKIQMILLEQNI